MIEFSELSKNYGAFRALAPLNLTRAARKMLLAPMIAHGIYNAVVLAYQVRM